MKRISIILATVLLLSVAFTAFAHVLPYGYNPGPAIIKGKVSADELYLREGPGTGRYFSAAGNYRGVKDSLVPLLAYTYDPNNGIYWVKVQWPAGTGHTGWTGYSRFYASSFNLWDLPYESWYPGY